jgi:hypothetical protein
MLNFFFESYGFIHGCIILNDKELEIQNDGIGGHIHLFTSIGRAPTTEENGKWGETKQRSENQVAFNSVLGPS